MKVRVAVVLALSVVMAIPGLAQTCSKTSYTNTLICTVPQLFGPQGMTLANPKHDAHFADNSQAQFRPLNQAIGQELSILPLGSSGSGTTFTLDSEGHPVPTEDSLGPILTERANVIGRKAISLGVAYQYFGFDKIDGINLHNFPAVLLHEDSEDLTKITSVYQNDYVTTMNQAHLDLNQTVVYAVFGIAKRMDASVELPIQSVHFRVTSQAHIAKTQPCEVTKETDPHNPYFNGGTCAEDPITHQPLTTDNPAVCGEFHYFAGTTDLTPDNCQTIFNSGDANFPYPGAPGLITVNGKPTPQPLRTGPPMTDANGIGDITLRAKYEVIREENFTASVGMGIRFASGDAKNFLGTGAYGLIPFGAVTRAGRFSPHARFGYEWNSHSILAGDPTGSSPTSISLAPAFLYSGGADYRVTKWVTVAGDLIGERVRSASRLSIGNYQRLVDLTQPKGTQGTLTAVESIKPRFASYNSDAIAVGGKIRLKKELVLIGNATIRVDDGGLRANVVPLVGLSYAF
jgi:Putative MetA-pathway of phenol degradation